MKKLTAFLAVLFVMATACKESAVKKPEKLIDEDQMTDIIYDLSVLDALKSQGYGPAQNYPTPAELLKKKYQVDSLTFAENSKYYAADTKNYKKMYDKVRERLSAEGATANGGVPANPYPEEAGVVK